MRGASLDLQVRASNHLRRQLSGRLERCRLVVVAMDDERLNVDLFRIRPEVGLGEGLETVDCVLYRRLKRDLQRLSQDSWQNRRPVIRP